MSFAERFQLAGPLHLRLSPKGVRAVRGGHPWVFDQAIAHQRGEGVAGALAVLHDDKRRQIGLGLYDPDSPIRVRVVHHGGPTPVDDAFFERRVVDAIERRASLPRERTTGYRLVHGENDGLGALVVDRYADTLVIKLYSRAWLPRLDPVVSTLRAQLDPARVVLRLSRALQRHPLDGLQDGDVIDGEAPGAPVGFEENGLRFEADPIRGQKTGFFLDQRDNRARVGERASGRRVLNAFSYSGGFSLYAARGGAREVTSLDLSAPALADAERHFAVNQDDANVAACHHRALEGDAFEVLADLAARGDRFDLVVIDPPAFAKRGAEVERALRAYARLTRLGLAVLEEGGELVLASCSSRVDAETFRENAERAARAAGRPLVVELETGHALDHPITFPEGAYLKCLFARA